MLLIVRSLQWYMCKLNTFYLILVCFVFFFGITQLRSYLSIWNWEDPLSLCSCSVCHCTPSSVVDCFYPFVLSGMSPVIRFHSHMMLCLLDNFCRCLLDIKCHMYKMNSLSPPLSYCSIITSNWFLSLYSSALLMMPNSIISTKPKTRENNVAHLSFSSFLSYPCRCCLKYPCFLIS